MPSKPRDLLDDIVRVLSAHCDHPIDELILHLAGMVGFAGDDIDAGNASFKRVVNSGSDLEGMYKEYTRTLWVEFGHRLRDKKPVIDPLGGIVLKYNADKYQSEEFALTPMDVIRQNHASTIPNQEAFDKLVVSKSGVYHSPLSEISPENVWSILDPTCGTGRVGIDACAYYPHAVCWNMERDLYTYRVALLNARLLAPFVSCLLGSQIMECGRWNMLHADSLIVDPRDESNWLKGNNAWNPPNWRTSYMTIAGKTWADLQREVGENHAYDLLKDSMERTTEGASDGRTDESPHNRSPKCFHYPPAGN